MRVLLFNPRSSARRTPVLPMSLLAVGAVLEGRYEWSIVDGNLDTGDGSYEQQDMIPSYIETIVSDIQLTRPLNIAVDCGNGVAGVLAVERAQELARDVDRRGLLRRGSRDAKEDSEEDSSHGVQRPRRPIPWPARPKPGSGRVGWPVRTW